MTQKNEKRPLYRRPWFIAIAVVIGLGMLGSRKERRADSREVASPAVESTRSSSSVGSVPASDELPIDEAKPSGTAAEAEPADAEERADPDQTATKWRYDESEDAMTGHVTRFASVTSENEYELDFPYQGGTRASLTLRQHPRHGVDVLATINRGQLLCNMFSGCRVLVRFDDRPPIKFKGTESSDHDSQTIFLAPTAKLIKEARRSKKAAVELEFFQGGSKVFFFDVEGLEWE